MSLRILAALLSLASFTPNPPQAQSASEIEHRAVTQCSWDGTTFSLRDKEDTFVGKFDEVTIRGRFAESVDKPGAIFTFSRGGKLLLRKFISDMSNPNGWISISTDQKWFAINSSNGGAAGGWSVSIVHLQQDGSVRDLSVTMETVAKSFSSRHDCATRGDNYESIRWIAADQLLLTASVYGTSDCGSEMGYTEGYVLQPSTGTILKRYSEADLLHMPFNCTYNTWRPDDPSQK
jgi:hypothetical protein